MILKIKFPSLYTYIENKIQKLNAVGHGPIRMYKNKHSV